jgi:hypothetical protein
MGSCSTLPTLPSNIKPSRLGWIVQLDRAASTQLAKPKPGAPGDSVPGLLGQMFISAAP